MANWVKNLYNGEENGSSSESDEEMPEVVSTSQMKSMREGEINELREKKKTAHDVQKARKKLMMEKFLSEKKTKATTKSLQQISADEDKLKDSELPDAEESISKPKKLIKVYPKLNINVQTLQQIPSSRAKAAINFKSKRLAKVNREDVAKTIISYQEKLNAKSK